MILNIYKYMYFPTLELKDSVKCNKEIITTISVLKVYICIKLSFIMKTMEGSFGEIKLPSPTLMICGTDAHRPHSYSQSKKSPSIS